MIDRKMKWLTILTLLAATSHCQKPNNLYHPPSNAATSAGSLFLVAPDPGTLDARTNEIAAYNEHGGLGNIVKPHELNIFQEPALEFGPQSSPTKFMTSGELPTGSFGQQPTDAFNPIFVKTTMPERPERHQSLFDRTAKSVKHHNYNDGDQFMYNLETDNGITNDARGSARNGVETQGGYSYTGDNGVVYSIRYAAGKKGFNARGSHLPTPPPIPVEILRAMGRNVKDEANGIYDDGSYDPHKFPGNYHYDPVPGTSSNDAMDHVNNHNHIYTNEDPGTNHAGPVYTESSVDMHQLQGNNNVQNLNAVIGDTVVTDAANPKSFTGFRSLEAAARIGGVAAPPPSRNRFKGAQYLPPVPMNAQHLDIGAPTVIGNQNRRVMLPNRQPQRYDPKNQIPVVIPRTRQNGF